MIGNTYPWLELPTSNQRTGPRSRPSLFPAFPVTVAVSLMLISCTRAKVIDDPMSGHRLAAGAHLESAGQIIPRRVLFADPDRSMVRLSPDGSYLSFLAPADGVKNIWIAPVEDLDAATPLTSDTFRGVQYHQWAHTSRHIIYATEQGDENWAVYGIDIESRETISLSPSEGVNARLIGHSLDHPEALLLGLNDRDPRLHDVYRVDILTGERELVFENSGFLGFLADNDLQLRLAVRMTAEGGQAWFKANEEGEWEPFIEVPMEDMLTTSFFAFDGSNEKVYLVDSRGRDTAALASLNLRTGEHTVLHADERADVQRAIFHPATREIQAAGVEYARTEWVALDPGIEEDLARLRAVADGDIEVVSRALDDRVWIVGDIVDDGPFRYFLYNRESGEPRYLFSMYTGMEGLNLSRMEAVVIGARDGLDLVSYLTIPHFAQTNENGRPVTPLPLVLNVHGGPWARDSWGFRTDHQWLADRGYAVLSVNFRGSTGFGKSFINAMNLEWGAKAHDDLLDAVSWAVEEGIADPKRVAIYGWSYGGYATLAGLTMTPDTFACGVNVVGVSNLVTLLETVPPYWEPMMEMWTTRVGDHRSEEGRAFLTERSPLTHVDSIRRPLLIAHGAHDVRVKRAESDQIVQAMKERSIPVTYLLYPDEGHSIVRPANRFSFLAVMEAFLSECLGGRFEPVGSDLEGSSMQVLEGAEQVPGLNEILAETPAQAEVAEEEAVE